MGGVGREGEGWGGEGEMKHVWSAEVVMPSPCGWGGGVALLVGVPGAGVAGVH